MVHLLESEVHLLTDYFNTNQQVRVAVYGRVSTEHIEQLMALENQIQYYDNIIAEHPNWVLVDRYIDKGITGTSMEKRDSFLRMMNDAKKNKFDLIITREVCRFARNTVDALQQVRVLLSYGVGVHFKEDGIWTVGTDEDWELKLSLMATLAQNESKRVSIRAKAGQAISFKNGVFYGNGNILGYDRVNKDMVINREQADTVRRIFELYLQGNGLRSIMFILEQEGRKTATGKTKWSAEVISRVLKNQFYTGTIVYRKEYTPDYLTHKKVRNNGEVEQVIVEGRHEPIISKEDFAKVQEILTSKVRESGGKKVGHGIPKDVYCRKLICECGRTFNKRTNYTTKDGEKRYIYQCYHQLRSGTVKTRLNKGLATDDACTSLVIPGWKLDVVSDFIFRKFFANKQMIFEKVMDIVNTYVGANTSLNEIHKEIEKCKEDIEKAIHKVSALVDLYTDGDISKEIYLMKKAEAENKVDYLKNTLTELQNKAIAAEMDCNIEERKRKIAEFLALKPFKKEAPIPAELIGYYVKAIEVDSDKMNWILHIPNKEDCTEMLSVHESKKKEVVTLTPLKKQVPCATQHRLLLATNLTKREMPRTLINMGTYSISKDYVRRIKKYYKDIDRSAKNGSFEIQITFLV